MTDACTITTGGTPTWNTTSETYVVTGGATVYSGPCRVKMPNAMSHEYDAAAQAQPVIRPEVHIPAGVEGVTVGQTVTITSTEFNPSLSGALFRVTSLFRHSQATAQRLECSEVQ